MPMTSTLSPASLSSAATRASAAGISSSSSSPTLTTARTRRFVSRKYGASSSRCSGVEPGAVQRATVGQRVVRGLQRGDLLAERLVELGLARRLVEPLLDRLEVGEGELDLDDAQVLDRVGRARHVVVDERPQHEHDGVDLADVGEELVAEALALAGALDEAADVDDLHGGVHDVAALGHLGQAVEALVGHLGDADVRVLGGERVRRGERAAAREGVVQRALPGVGEADEAEAFHAADDATGAAGYGPSHALCEPTEFFQPSER